MILLKLMALLLLFPVFYSFVAYPIILFFLSLLSRKKKTMPLNANTLSFSFVLPAYNESCHIEQKLDNLLSFTAKYKIEILVGDDGSTDDTAAKILSWKELHPAVDLKFIAKEKNAGKWVLLKELVAMTTGDIIIFSDISAELPSSFFERMLAQINKPEVAVYAPTYAFSGETRKKFWERIYWPIEHFIRVCESRWFSTIGAHGACYAVKKVYLPNLERLEINGIAPINDDFLIPTFAAATHHKVIAYDVKNCVLERDSVHTPVEYRRRLRIARGNYSMNRFLMYKLPWHKYPSYFFLYFSHKVIRSYIGPLSFLSFLLFSCLSWGDLRYNFLGILLLMPCLFLSPLRASIQVFYLERGSSHKSW